MQNPHVGGEMSLPAWYPQVFGHLSSEDYSTVARLWHEEAALRTLIASLDGEHPDNRSRVLQCPDCGNRNISIASSVSFLCKGCSRRFTRPTGTPFHRLHRQSYGLLYAAAVMLWGPWSQDQAWRLTGCCESRQLLNLRGRLQPLLDELQEVLVSHPAYRLGFSPQQQGIRCLRCDGERLRYANRTDAGNPKVGCMSCGYSFFLTASRRHLLPLPAGLRCPDCESVNLNRATVLPDGRGKYRCRDCRRNFVERPIRTFSRLKPAVGSAVA